MNRIALVGNARDSAPLAAEGDRYRYWAFLSYSHADSKQADRLHNWLERFHTPQGLIGNPHPLGTIPSRLTPVFRDRHELAAASSLGREIDEALNSSRYLIVLCSPAAVTSRWVDQEIRAFKRIHGEDRVLAAIVAGEPFSGDDDECFPEALRHRVGKDGRITKQRVEPIAADLRDEREGWRTGALQLVAGLLDVGLDDLIQRDQLRRQRRMTWIAAASIAGMAFTTGLSVVAINARDAARDERRQAEGLVGFMLGDLKAELEPIQRLDALDQVGARALAYYERQDQKELTDDQLAQRSKALTLLGQIATTRGDSEAALARYQEALRGTGELIARYPNDPQKLFDHAQNVFYVGDIARQRGQLNRAEAAYRDYMALGQRMVAAEPGNPKWQMEVLYARENLGIAKYYQRRFADASRDFDATTQLMERLAAHDSANKEYQGELSNSLAWLADARRDEGQLDLAIRARHRQIAFLRGLLVSTPNNAQLRERLLPALRAFGVLMIDTGRPKQAMSQYRETIAEASRLLADEEKNATWQGERASAQIDLAAILISQRQLDAARLENDVGCAATGRLRQRDPKTSLWTALTTSCLINQGKLALASGDPAQALVEARKALASASSERGVDPVRDRLRVATTMLLIGDVQRALKDDRAAQQTWKDALNRFPSGTNLKPRELGDRYALLMRLGLNREAREVDQRLTQMGYKPRS